MLQNKRINIIYRIICLIVFVVVTYKINNFIALALLAVAFYVFTRNEDDFLIFLWHLITIVIFLISYLMGVYLILKIVLIIDLCYYFLSIPSSDVVIKKKTFIVDKYMLRFANRKIEGKDIVSNNDLCTMYVTTHLLILFLIIVVSSCAI